MTLVQSWIDSLSLLKPKNLQLFLMVTLKSILETYKLMFKYFWWVLIIQLICYIYLSIQSFFMVAVVLQSLLFFMICAITRPSIVKKNCAYLRTQFFPYLCYAGLIAGLSVIIFLCKVSMPASFYVLFYTWIPFFILFFLDSDKSIKSYFLSMWYALKMIFFNLPLIVCAYAVLFLFNGAFTWIAEWIAELLSSLAYQGLMSLVSNFTSLKSIVLILFSVIGGLHYFILQGVLFLPISICLYANIYIKRLHDQFELYYKQPQ